MKIALRLTPLLLLFNIGYCLAQADAKPAPDQQGLSKQLEKVFKDYEVDFQKVNLEFGPDCLEFHLIPKQDPAWSEGSYMSNLYYETLEANGDKPFSIVDSRDNTRINISWKDKDKRVLESELESIETKPKCAKQ